VDGLPKKIALELYQPFIIRRLKELGHADNDQERQADAGAQRRRGCGISWMK